MTGITAAEVQTMISARQFECGHCSGYWGLRALCDDEEYEAGDSPRESYAWDFDEDVSCYETDGETIGGACAIDIGDWEEESDIEDAIRGVMRYLPRRVALIHAMDREYGNDPGEVILSDAVVVAVWEVA